MGGLISVNPSHVPSSIPMVSTKPESAARQTLQHLLQLVPWNREPSSESITSFSSESVGSDAEASPMASPRGREKIVIYPAGHGAVQLNVGEVFISGAAAYAASVHSQVYVFSGGALEESALNKSLKETIDANPAV